LGLAAVKASRRVLIALSSPTADPVPRRIFETFLVMRAAEDPAADRIALSCLETDALALPAAARMALAVLTTSPTAELVPVKLTRIVLIAVSSPTFGLDADLVAETERLMDVAEDPAAARMALAIFKTNPMFGLEAVSVRSLVLISCTEAKLGEAAASVVRTCFTTTPTFGEAADLMALTTRLIAGLFGDAALRIALG